MLRLLSKITKIRGGSGAAASSKMERFVITVNGFHPLTIITKHSILNVAAVLDPPLKITNDVFSMVAFLFQKVVIFDCLDPACCCS